MNRRGFLRFIGLAPIGISLPAHAEPVIAGASDYAETRFSASRHYFHGAEWTEAELAILRKRNQPVVPYRQRIT